MSNVLEQFSKITTFIFDIDGVLTDSTILLLENGLQARKMNIKDGLALQMAVKSGYRVLVVSGGDSEESVHRLKKLGLTEVHVAVKDKKGFVEGYAKQNGLPQDELLFMGDDLPDLSLMSAVGVACCPADGVSEIKNACQYISPFTGGSGCVRDVIEKVMKIRGHWEYRTDVVSK